MMVIKSRRWLWLSDELSPARSISAFFVWMISFADLSKILEMSRSSRSAGNGSQSTSLFRQYGDRLRTTMGTNGRRSSTLNAAGLETDSQPIH